MVVASIRRKMFNEPCNRLRSQHFPLQDGNTVSGMGTKLEHAINVLAPSQNSTSFSVHFVDDLEDLQTKELNNNFRITGFYKSCSLINDRMPEKHNINFIRKTMQIQENIFKYQVRELHRLYSVQKLLMEEVNKEIKQNKKYWTTMTSNSDIVSSHKFINLQNKSTTQQPNFQHNLNIQNLRDDTSPRERSGSCSGETIRIMTRGLDLERPAEEDISTAVSHIIYHDYTQAGSSSSCLHKTRTSSDDESEVELTLGIGSSSKSKKSTNHHQEVLDSPASFKSERGEDSTPTTPMSGSSTTLDQERKEPHWLFQSLSINRTI